MEWEKDQLPPLKKREYAKKRKRSFSKERIRIPDRLQEYRRKEERLSTIPDRETAQTTCRLLTGDGTP